jgi:hypothetical protein
MPRLFLAAPILLALALTPAAAQAKERPAVCVRFWTPNEAGVACDPAHLNTPPSTGCPTVDSPAYGYGVSVCYAR